MNFSNKKQSSLLTVVYCKILAGIKAFIKLISKLNFPLRKLKEPLTNIKHARKLIYINI